MRWGVALGDRHLPSLAWGHSVIEVDMLDPCFHLDPEVEGTFCPIALANKTGAVLSGLRGGMELLAYRDESGPAPSFRSHGIDH